MNKNEKKPQANGIRRQCQRSVLWTCSGL